MYGLSGRDITVEDFEDIYKDLADVAVNGVDDEMNYRYIGIRE